MRLISAIATRCNIANTSLQRSDVGTIGFTYFTLAIGVSVLHLEAGTDPVLVIVAAMVVNSATATLAFAAVMSAGGSFVAALGSGWLVSTRFGVLAAAVAPMLWPSRTKRALAAFCAFDPNVAMALAQSDARAARRAYAVISAWLVLPWWAGSVVGLLVDSWIGDARTLGLDSMFPAVFLAVVWPQLRLPNNRVIAVAAAAVGVGLVEMLPGGLAVLLAGLTAVWALRASGDSGRAAAGGVESGTRDDTPC